MQDVLHGVVQQLAVVADDEGGVRVFLQPRLQPQGAFQIEVVGRLVQQQQVGLREQGRGQRHAHPPAARELRHRPRQVLGREAEPAQDLGGAGRAHGRRRSRQAARRYRRCAPARRFPARRRARRARCRRPGRCRAARPGWPHAPGPPPPRAPARHHDLPAIRLQGAEDELEQSGLANAVPADQADLGIQRQSHRRTVEKAASPGIENDVVDLDHSLGCRKRGAQNGAERLRRLPCGHLRGKGPSCCRKIPWSIVGHRHFSFFDIRRITSLRQFDDRHPHPCGVV